MCLKCYEKWQVKLSKIKFEIYKYNWYKGKTYMLSSVKKYTHKGLTELVKKIKNYRIPVGRWKFGKIDEPTTFPKFSNENSFYLIWDKKRIHNPKILGIRWVDDEWQYRLENIGHTYDYQSETKLRAKIKE